MKFIQLVFFLSIYLALEILAQSQPREIVEISNYGKPYNKNSGELEYYKVNFLENNDNSKSVIKKLDSKYQDIVGKEMIVNFENFSIELIINSDSTLFWKDKNSINHYKENTKTIYIDEYSTFVSWLGSNKKFLSMYSDFKNGRIAAFLRTDNGKIKPVNGAIKLNN